MSLFDYTGQPAEIPGTVCRSCGNPHCFQWAHPSGATTEPLCIPCYVAAITSSVHSNLSALVSITMRTPESAFRAGKVAAALRPPRVISAPASAGFVMSRELGLNPCKLWSDEWREWDRGYFEEARAAVQERL